MNQELEKAKRDVWGLLEAGEWLDAKIAAVHLAEIEPGNSVYRALANNVGKLAEIAEKVERGKKRGSAAKLDEVAAALPEIKELASFKALAASAVYSEGKKGVLISVVVALIFVMLCNYAGYKYIQSQPISTEAQRTVIQGWLGIQQLKKPVDVILLGDSTCGSNLTPGPVADRLGGSVINLGNTVGSSLLMDAWMLSNYIEQYGPPKAVVVSRSSLGYCFTHTVETMANVPLSWGYWDTYRAVPDWKDGEIRNLFIAKYCVLYSDADNLRERLLKAWNLFDYGIVPRIPSHYYSAGYNLPKGDMDFNARIPSDYFGKFYWSTDSTNAIKCMVNMAKKYNFQLYFTLQAEWDEAVNAGLRADHLAAEKKYLSQFTDNTYVHIVDQFPKTLFTFDQMENPRHLWHGSEKIYTEEIVNGIVAVQNSLTIKQAKNMEVTSVAFDKDSYKSGDQPALTLKVTDPPGDNAPTTLNGGVSCLIKPAGDIDAHWAARAPAKSITLNGDEVKEITLQLTAGKLEPGAYDVVVFLRQDVAGLSHETRIEMPNQIIVN